VITGINDTGDKFLTGVNDTGKFHEWQGFFSSIVDIGEHFFAGIVDTGEELSPMSLIPVMNSRYQRYQ